MRYQGGEPALKTHTHNFFYKQQGLSNESLDCENVKQRESRFEMKMAKLSNKKIISKQENE